MKPIWQNLRNRVIAGVLFLVPVFVVANIIYKIWTNLTGAGNYLAKTLGLSTLLGSNSVPIMTALLLFILFYMFGWLVKFSMLTKSKDWIERSILQFIPGYLSYKAQMQEKIKPSEDTRIPVLVNTADGKKPGLLIEEHPGDMVIFFPNSPDSNNGQVLLIEKSKVTKLDISPKILFQSMQKFGKGLR